MQHPKSYTSHTKSKTPPQIEKLYKILHCKSIDPNFSFSKTFDIDQLDKELTSSDVQELEKEGKNNNAQACYLLSQLAFFGIANVVDPFNDWMEKAATLNHPVSLYYSAKRVLGNCMIDWDEDQTDHLNDVLGKFQNQQI